MTTFEELRRRGLLAQLTDEKEIEELEQEDAAIDAEFEQPEVACDPVKCTDLGNRKEQIASRLEELYMIWEELSEE
jgi:hypothetical protein